MKKNKRPGAGYTITEVMIFLAVSSALLTSTLLLMNGHQSRQEFNQASREADSRVQDIINDVSTGFFPDSTNFSCTVPPSDAAPIIAPITSPSPSLQQEQGTREGCGFIGKVLQFAPTSTGAEGFKVISVAGRQYKNTGVLDSVENIVEARPTPLILTIPGSDLTQDVRFGHGLRVTQVKYQTTSGNWDAASNIGAIGFFSSFASDQTLANDSGRSSTQLVVIDGSALNQNNTDIANQIRQLGNGTIESKAGFINRPTVICLEGRDGRVAAIRLAESRSQLATTLTIDETEACN